MNHWYPRRQVVGIFVAGAMALAGGRLSAASYLDTNGFTALRATTTNLNGTGVTVAQAEADDPNTPPGTNTWEVNPAAGVVGQPAGLFKYFSTGGSTNAFPNQLGLESGHAEEVAGYLYGLPSGEAPNVAAVNNYEGDYFYNSVIAAPLPASINSPVANQSFIFDGTTVSQQQAVDSVYDDYAAEYGTLFVSGAGNGGTVSPPATSYNGLGVGAYGTVYSSTGPTADNSRCKPDLTAPANYTSDSTPQVSGAAVVLLQAALRGDGGDTNAADLRALKALLLNGAVKPAGWTNSSTSPLDARYGAGLVNIFNSYHQLAGGKHAYIVSSSISPIGGAHPPTGAAGTVNAASGWDYNSLSSGFNSDVVNHYYFNATNPLFTATLVWNRQRNQTNINHLNLYLYNAANSNLVAACTSAVDNVQHLFLTNLPAGRYDLQVLKPGGIPGLGIVSAAETYALAFDFSRLALSFALNGTNAVLTWPLYPAGPWLAATPSLNPPATWSVVSLTPAITNNLYRVVVPGSGGSQFFQLRQP